MGIVKKIFIVPFYGLYYLYKIARAAVFFIPCVLAYLVYCAYLKLKTKSLRQSANDHIAQVWLVNNQKPFSSFLVW